MRARCVFPSGSVALIALCIAPVACARPATIAFAPPQTVLADDICMDLVPMPGPNARAASAGLMTVHAGRNRVGILANDGAGNLGPGGGTATLPDPRAGALADVNGDGFKDLFLISSIHDRVDLLHGSATGFVHSASVNPGDAPFAGQVGDFNGNGMPDLACALYNANQLAIIEPAEGGKLEAVLRYNVPSRPYDVALGDLNGDNVDDVAVACYGGNNVAIVLNPGGPTGGASVVAIAGGSRPKALGVADFDSDGRNDIARADSQSGRVVIMRNLGSGQTYDQAQSVYVGQDPSDLAICDFDGDGNPDIAVSCGPSFAVALMINQGAGAFAVQQVPFNFRPGRIAVTDLNQDGLPDLVVADQQSETVVVLINATDVAAIPCPGDADADLRVNLNDLQLVLFDLGKDATATEGRGTDLNGDGAVNLADLNVLLFHFGAVCGEE